MNKLHLRTYPCSLEYEKTPHLLQRRVWREATRLLAVSKQLLPTTRGRSGYETLCQLSFQLVSRKHSQRWLRLAFRSALRRRRASARVSCRSRAPAAFPLEPRAICVRNKVAHFPAIGSVVCSSARSLTAVLTGFWTLDARNRNSQLY